MIQDALAVFHRGTAVGAVAGRLVLRLIRRGRHLQRASRMAFLTTRLAPRGLAQRLGAAHDLFLHAFLRRRGAAVARVLVRLLVFGQALGQLLDELVLLAKVVVQLLHVTVQRADFTVLGIDRGTHRTQQFRHLGYHRRYVITLVFHTANLQTICHATKDFADYFAFILLNIK
mgnify:CR=1 FL=1